jgi:cbb3-type cytochrome oxidase cytochrome c subunit
MGSRDATIGAEHSDDTYKGSDSSSATHWHRAHIGNQKTVIQQALIPGDILLRRWQRDVTRHRQHDFVKSQPATTTTTTSPCQRIQLGW